MLLRAFFEGGSLTAFAFDLALGLAATSTLDTGSALPAEALSPAAVVESLPAVLLNNMCNAGGRPLVTTRKQRLARWERVSPNFNGLNKAWMAVNTLARA